MSPHTEIKFEDEICDHLATHGWLYADNDAASYDRRLALFPSDVLLKGTVVEKTLESEILQKRAAFLNRSCG